MTCHFSNNTFGSIINLGKNGNGIFSTELVDKGGENPTTVLQLTHTTKSETGAETTIVIGNVDIGTGSGGTISGVLAGYLRDLMTNWTQPMVDFITEDISSTVLPNYQNTLPNSQNTMYERDISNISQYAPGSNVSPGDWTDNHLIATFALSSLGVVNRGLLLYLDNIDLKKQVQNIADQIRNELKSVSMPTQTGIMVDVTASALIDMRYLFYVEKYGPPMNGVFDPIKLAEFV
jgi:hypothetical protein